MSTDSKIVVDLTEVSKTGLWVPKQIFNVCFWVQNSVQKIAGIVSSIKIEYLYATRSYPIVREPSRVQIYILLSSSTVSITGLFSITCHYSEENFTFMILFAMIFSSSNNLTLPGELIPVPFKNPYNDDTNKQKTLFDLPKSAFLHKVDLTWYSRIYA